MTFNILICFFLTLIFISCLYKRITLKALRRDFDEQDECTSFIDYGLEKADYVPFKKWKFLKLDRFVNSKFYIKFMRKFYLIQVLLSILGYIALIILNIFDKYNILSMKW